MFFYFIIFFIFVILQMIMLGIIISNLELDIEECDVSYNVETPSRFNIKKLKVNIKLFLFKKIKILKIKIYKNYCEIFGIKIHLNVLKKLKDDKEHGTIFIFRNIWKLKPKIKKVDFEIEGGTENILVTTFLIPAFSTIVFSLISKNMKEMNSNFGNKELENSNCNLKIIPRYVNTNNLSLKGNFQVDFDTMKILFFIRKHRKIKV